MSEFQYIEFRAVDRPLTEKELAYGEKRCEVGQVTFSKRSPKGSCTIHDRGRNFC